MTGMQAQNNIAILYSAPSYSSVDDRWLSDHRQIATGWNVGGLIDSYQIY
jgi:hypothetical protein